MMLIKWKCVIDGLSAGYGRNNVPTFALFVLAMILVGIHCVSQLILLP
jgi:hypothetical protein